MGATAATFRGMTYETTPHSSARLSLRWLLGGLLLAAALAGALVLDPEQLFGLLQARYGQLAAWVEANYALAGLLYMVLYLLGVGLSLPGAVWMTILGGALFGTVGGTVFTVLAASGGAVAVFLVARYVARDWVAGRAGPWVRRLESGFRDHAFNFLLVLRLVPLFPFWVVNLVPALLGVRLPVYAAATLLGIIPGTIVFASLGAGFARVIERGGRPDPAVIFEPQVLLPILGIAVLALLPVAWKKWKGKTP